MSLRQLVEGDCGGINPLMQLGGQFTRDVARKDEGYARAAQFERHMRPDEQMVNEFMGQVSAPPQSFQMETLLQEMREIEIGGAQLQAAPRVIDEVVGGEDMSSAQWAQQFNQRHGLPPPSQILYMPPQQQQLTHVREFFDEGPSTSFQHSDMSQFYPRSYMNMGLPPPVVYQQQPQQQHPLTDAFFDETGLDANTATQELPKSLQPDAMADWINDYQTNKEENEQITANYNEKFWSRLQDEWQKLSEEADHPWLSEFDESYDPYKEYEFAEENPMAELENAFAKGKEYLTRGDIPSAVMCFEIAAKKEPENADVWQHLGLAQAENERDPQSIAALRRAIDLQPNNGSVLMALAVCYTNESLPSHAVKMLTKWLQVHPQYQHLVAHEENSSPTELASSLIGSDRLSDVQQLFLQAARQNPQAIDADVQEALGVLYNLSSDFDKAVDCFRAALQVNPKNAKVWNRLGASLANGSRSVEAVEAYQTALELEPGFIRVRYNVGVCCMNLKAYPQAVEHLLTALNMQANTAASRELPAGSAGGGSGIQQMSDSIWGTLKMVVSLMGRSDLQGHLNDRNLNALNEAFKE